MSETFLRRIDRNNSTLCNHIEKISEASICKSIRERNGI